MLRAGRRRLPPLLAERKGQRKRERRCPNRGKNDTKAQKKKEKEKREKSCAPCVRVVFEVSVHTQLRLQQTFSDGPLRPDTNPAFRAQTLAKEEGWPMYLPLPTLGPLFCARFLSSFAQTQALIPKRGRQRDLDKQKQLALSTRYLASRVSAAESPIPSPHPLCAECMLPRRRDFTSGSLFLSRSPRDKSSSLPCWCVACVTKTGHDGSDHDRGMPHRLLQNAI